MFKTSFLLASLIWGSVGAGYFVYGKRQQSFTAMGGGISMIVASYFISSALLQSVVCLGIIAGVFWLARRGY